MYGLRSKPSVFQRDEFLVVLPASPLALLCEPCPGRAEKSTAEKSTAEGDNVHRNGELTGQFSRWRQVAIAVPKLMSPENLYCMVSGTWGQFHALGGVSYVVAIYSVELLVGLLFDEAILKAIKMGEVLLFKNGHIIWSANSASRNLFFRNPNMCAHLFMGALSAMS